MFPNLFSIQRKGRLNCPDCHEIMTPYLCENNVVDQCLICEGIWFDSKEFSGFKRSLDQAALPRIESHSQAGDKTFVISHCPRCHIDLEDKTYAYNTNVNQRVCRSCSGHWMPYSELIKLIKLIKLSQQNSEDLSGLAKEISILNQEAQNFKSLQKSSDQLRRPVSLFTRYYAFKLLFLAPLYDENPRHIFPLGTISLIVINSVIFLRMLASDIPVSQIYAAYALYPSEIFQGESLGTLFSSLFLHAGPLHLMGNMYFLWTFGDNVECRLGTFKFIIFYLFCGLLAGLAQAFSGPTSTIPILGASGAISGILGAYIIFFPYINVKTLVAGHILDLPAWMYLGFWILIQVFSSLAFSASDMSGGVAWWAHVGGFAAGLFAVIIFKRNKAKVIHV